MKRSLLIAFLSVVAIGPRLAAQAPRSATEFDPGFGLGVELSRRVRLDFFSGREKSDDLGSAKWKGSAGISFRMKSVFPRFLDALDSDKSHALVVGATYEYSRASDSGGKTIEHKVMADGTARYAFAEKLLAANRVRFEFRWVNGEFRFRFRDRLTLERVFKVRSFEFTPYAGVEAFWDAHAHRQQPHLARWNQFRYTAGTTIPIYRRMFVDIYYERAHCTTCSTLNTNILGASLNIFVKRRK